MQQMERVSELKMVEIDFDQSIFLGVSVEVFHPGHLERGSVEAFCCFHAVLFLNELLEIYPLVVTWPCQIPQCFH